MERDSRKAVEEEGFAWGPDTIEAEIRERIRGMIETIVDEELEAVLGAGRSERVDARIGYRHGARERQLSTSLGKTTIKLPRARLKGAEGAESEWHSRIIPRYQRRTERVDAALLGTYLSGINTRRLRGALSPLLRGAPLSKDAVSRLVGRLRDEFTAWGDPRPRSRRGLLSILGWLVSASANWQKAGACTGAGRPGGMRGRPPHRVGDADRGPGKRGCLARTLGITGGAALGDTEPGGNRR